MGGCLALSVGGWVDVCVCMCECVSVYMLCVGNCIWVWGCFLVFNLLVVQHFVLQFNLYEKVLYK